MIETYFAYDCRLINPTPDEVAYQLRTASLCANARNRVNLLEVEMSFWRRQEGLLPTVQPTGIRYEGGIPEGSRVVLRAFTDEWGNDHYRIRSMRGSRMYPQRYLGLYLYYFRSVNLVFTVYPELEVLLRWGFDQLVHNYETVKELRNTITRCHDGTDSLDPMVWLTLADAIDDVSDGFVEFTANIRWAFDRRLLNVRFREPKPESMEVSPE